MGTKSKLTVAERCKVVLSLILREEPAAVLASVSLPSQKSLQRGRIMVILSAYSALPEWAGAKCLSFFDGNFKNGCI